MFCLGPFQGGPRRKVQPYKWECKHCWKHTPMRESRDYCQWWEAEHGLHVSRASMSRAIHAIGPIANKGEQKSERAIEEEPLSPPKLIKQALQKRGWGLL